MTTLLARKILVFFQKHFLWFLLLLALISYGQLLFMQPWQEDNVIFFKVSHINEQAGYLGRGINGEGPYRHIITPYFLLFSFFGYTIPLFYLLALIFFIIATFTVYLLFKTILGKKAGMFGSVFFACGYAAYDGYVRIYNSISSSVGITFASLLLIFYWKFYQSKSFFYYFLCVIFYYLAVEFSNIRTHYLIIPTLLFEFLFFSNIKKPKTILSSIQRSIPFLLIFYKIFIVDGDTRSKGASVLFESILKGQLENTFSFFSSLGYLFVPDKIQGLLIDLSSSFYKPLYLVEGMFYLAFLITSYFLITKNRLPRIILLANAVLGIFWFYFTKGFFIKPTLIYSSPESVLASFIAGLFLVLLVKIVLIFKGEKRKLIIIFSAMIVANLLAYSVYTPFNPYPTGYRYQAHSHLAWIGILTILALFLVKKKLSLKFAGYIFFAWALVYLGLGLFNMNNIIHTKSLRIDSFYKQLKSQVSYFPKDSLIYFDVSDNMEARSFYGVSFSVAEMPNTTAIAWRYGIDRYDISMYSDYPEFLDAIKKNHTPPNKIFTFFISADKLTNTTDSFRKLSQSKKTPIDLNIKAQSIALIKKESDPSIIDQPELILNLPNNIPTLTPINLNFEILANPINITNSIFPIKFKAVDDPAIYQDSKLQSLALDYIQNKSDFLKNGNFSASSQWMERTLDRIHDSDIQTYWQADRILWQNHQVSIDLNLGSVQDINGLVWLNGTPNNTPTLYQIETSVDKKTWQVAKKVSSQVKLDQSATQIIKFDPVKAQFIKMTINATISDDSPTISEIWPLLTKFSDLDILKAQSYGERPFDLIPNLDIYNKALSQKNYIGDVRVYWSGDKTGNWTSQNDSLIPITYDNLSHSYSLKIMPNGTFINQIKLSDFNLPGDVFVHSVSFQTIPISEN